MNVWQVAQGMDVAFLVTITDDNGNPITSYTGSAAARGQGLAGRRDRGDLRPRRGATPAVGTVNVPIAAANTNALGLGTYRVQVTLLDGSYERDIYEGMLNSWASPGTAPSTLTGSFNTNGLAIWA